jgi:hypothetical protein
MPKAAMEDSKKPGFRLCYPSFDFLSSGKKEKGYRQEG